MIRLLKGHSQRRALLLLPELAHIQVVVEAPPRQEFGVGSLFDDLSPLKDQDLIGIADGAQAVGNDKAGSAV